VYAVANGDSEDVVQEAVARAIKSGVSLEAEQWLRTVARRVAIDQHRRRRETPSGAPADLEFWGASGDDPEDEVLRAERAKYVREALAALPPRYRRALMIYAEEDSPAAVANRLGLSATATWTLLSRARSRLKLQLEQAGFVPALIVNRPRLSGLVAAGAAAGVAATMAVAPSRPPAPQPDEVAKPKVVQVASPTQTPAATDDVVATKAPLLPVATDEVTAPVDDTLNEVKATPEKVRLGACLGPSDELDVGVDLWRRVEQPEVEQEKRTLVSGLRGVVDKTVGLPAATTCE
jgi:RNA polymerase sigma-70 factor (ECF subfamily)